MVIGLFMLFKMVRVTSFGFYRIGRISTSAIILVLLVLSLILGTELHFMYVTLVDILLVLIPMIVGTAILIRCAFEDK